jgi:hypothetical protein
LERKIIKTVRSRRAAHNKLVDTYDAAVVVHKKWSKLVDELKDAHELAQLEARADLDADGKIDVPELNLPPEPPVPQDPGDYVNLDPLDFWRDLAKELPYLAAAAKSFLSISISSAEIERLFSRAGLIINPLRNSLSRDKEEKFIIAGYNLTKGWKAARADGEGKITCARRIMGSLVDDSEADYDDDE